jgi:type II secretory pathway component PulF
VRRRPAPEFTMKIAYTARAAAGGTVEGVLDAASLAEARKRLREQGLFLLRASDSAGTTPKVRRSFGSRVTGVDLLMLTSQLSVMVRSGVDVAEALRNVAANAAKPALKAALDQIVRDVDDGQPVSAAIRRHPKFFDEAYVAGIAAGEATGKLPDVLSRLAELLRNQLHLRSTLRAVLSYPIVLISVMFLVLSALIYFVLPQFGTIFAEMEIPAPALTQMLLDASSALRENSLALLAGAAAIVGAGAWLWRRGTLRSTWDTVTLRAIGIRDVTQALAVGRAFRLMATMLQSGVPLLEALKLCQRSLRNTHYRNLFAKLEEEVLNGRGIGRTLVESPIVPRGAAQMVQTAERTGRLGSVLELVGEFYETEGERKLREVAKLLEPAIIVILGVVVAGVVLAVMLPIFDFSSAAHGG